MNGWLTALGPGGTALALLLLGHILGDFVFQTDEIAKNKHQTGPLLSHIGIVFIVHAVAFLPVLSTRTALLLVSVVVFHLIIDAVSARLRHQQATSVHYVFLGDLVAHLIVIIVGWSLLEASAWTASPVVTALGGENQIPWSAMTTWAVYLSAFVFAHKGGNALVRGVLPEEGPESDEDDLAVGYLIGSLERWIILVLGLAGMWEAVALVVAVKSIARFEELKQRAFAEYFLVGTLTSVLVAIVLVGLVTVLV